MQKIDFEIAKGLDERLDNENVCCFNVYTKDYFNANDKDMLISDNIKDDTNTTQAHINENYNNAQELIPDNVIRIQTQDGSGEFIEIVFDEFKEWEKSSSGAIKPLFTPLEGIVEDISNSLENVSIIGDTLAMLGAVKNPKNAKNIIKKKSLTRDEVLQIVDKLPKNVRDKCRRIVENKEELDKLWKKLTKNSKELENKVDKKYGQSIYMRKLDDQTIIQYKKASKSGGETIEINSNKPRGNLRTIHIENGVKNEV
ncbi:TPA: hypothetical protein RZK15_001806 [Campylobacter coli]|nr:hypothetical protein [Campylobacter coli]